MPPDVSVLRVKLSRKRRGMCAATYLITFLCVVPFNCIPYSDWVKFLIHAKKPSYYSSFHTGNGGGGGFGGYGGYGGRPSWGRR